MCPVQEKGHKKAAYRGNILHTTILPICSPDISALLSGRCGEHLSYIEPEPVRKLETFMRQIAPQAGMRKQYCAVGWRVSALQVCMRKQCSASSSNT
eukprot:scaffold104348_cov23-Tisochrysis_lutea.AAC.1